MNHILQKIKISDKAFYTKGEIVQLLESAIEKKPTEIVSNGVRVDLKTYTIQSDGKQVQLPRRIIDLVYYLMTNKGRIVNRDEILNNVWGSDVIVGERTIDVHISSLRQVLPTGCIKTIKGVGYRWN